ncbi:MAG: hypothetical protein LIO68_05395 [Rikenellaceae bacterium]|nr:hypothetical protein [Rikenellaceae bacterium]
MPKSGDKAGGLCPWEAFTYADATANEPWDTPVSGYSWGSTQVHGGNAWYPAGGARYNTSQLYVVGHSGYAWSTAAGNLYMAIDPGNVTPDRSNTSRVYCFSVRCVRE